MFYSPPNIATGINSSAGYILNQACMLHLMKHHSPLTVFWPATSSAARRMMGKPINHVHIMLDTGRNYLLDQTDPCAQCRAFNRSSPRPEIRASEWKKYIKI